MKLNSTTWCAKFEVLVTDPDGWDRQNFEASWNEEITEAEFLARLQRSTSLQRQRPTPPGGLGGGSATKPGAYP